MNDDFLRRVRRPPPPVFANRLREQLRVQELAEVPVRKPRSRLWIAALLIGGTTALAATLLAVKEIPLLSPKSMESSEPPSAAQSVAASDQPLSPSSSEAVDYENIFHPGRRTLQPPPASTSDNVASEARTAASTAPPTVAVNSASATAKPGALRVPRTSQTPDTFQTFAGVHIITTPLAAAMTRATARRIDPNARIDIVDSESTLKTLCEASDRSGPQVAISSHRILWVEKNVCQAHDLDTLSEAKIGYMAIVVTRAKNGAPIELKPDVLLRALLKKVPAPDDSSRLIDNPYTQWNQIDPALEYSKIEILGPARTSDEFATFVETVLEPACNAYSWISTLQSPDRRVYEEICHTLRDDGVYTEVQKTNTLITQRLFAQPNAVIVLDYPYYANNSEQLLGNLLPGPQPTKQSITNGSYTTSRPIYIYIGRYRPGGFGQLTSFTRVFLGALSPLPRDSSLVPTDEIRDWYRGPMELTEVRTDL